MRENFRKAVNFVILWEGYKTDDPDDPGGRTIFGISSKVYPQEVEEMWTLPKNEALIKAEEIYLNDYWIPIGCDAIQYQMDVIAFDTGVNMGINLAKVLIHDSYDPFDYLMRRIARYNDIAKNNPKFLRGWLNRVIALHKLIRRKDA